MEAGIDRRDTKQSACPAGQAQARGLRASTQWVAYLHMLFEPLQGKRHIRVTQQHTMQDFAHYMKWLVDEFYPFDEVIRVVLDNLSTHKPAALYEVFPPEEARRVVKKLDFHYTPKHGSWLNMAEIERSVCGRSIKKHP